MLTITKPSDNRVDITFDGGIDANIMTAALDKLFDASKDVKNGVSLYTITNFDMPTLGAIGVEFTKLPQLFGLLSKFQKVAILSDSAFIRTAGEVEGFLLPGVEIKSFHLNERAVAENWLVTPVDEPVISYN